jgi:hypothetical protein
VLAQDYLEVAIAPLDRARRAAFRWAAGHPRVRAIVYARDRRIVVQACVGAAVALALVVVAPIAVFALAPALFGVPHVVSDVRYLVVRQRLARWWLLAIVAGCAAVLVLRALAELTGGGSLDPAELAIAATWIAVACVAGAAVTQSWHRLVVALPIVGVLAALAIGHPAAARVALAHLHNVVALVVWALVFRRQIRGAAWPLAAVAIAAVVLVSGATVPLTLAAGGDAALGLDLSTVAGWLAPGVDGRLAAGLALSYVFLQSVHYAVWLGWIPQEQLPGESTMSFRRSLRSLVADLGAVGVWLAIALAAAMVVASVADLHRAREVYLSLAVFHGYLELAMLGYFTLARAR